MIVWDGIRLIELTIGAALSVIALTLLAYMWVSMKYTEWKKGRK